MEAGIRIQFFRSVNQTKESLKILLDKCSREFKRHSFWFFILLVSDVPLMS